MTKSPKDPPGLARGELPVLELSKEVADRLDALLAVETADFPAMAAAAGLDPKTSFRGKDLRGVDFGESDLSGFDFTDADLRGCNFLRARISQTIFANAKMPPRQAGGRRSKARGGHVARGASNAGRSGIPGHGRPETLLNMIDQARAYAEKGNYVAAQVLQEHILEIQERVLGAEHPDTLTSMNDLASTLRSLKYHAGAQAFQEQALDARRRVLGDEHPDTLTSVNSLASTLRS